MVKRCELCRSSRFAPSKRTPRCFTAENFKPRPFLAQAQNTPEFPDHHRFTIPASPSPKHPHTSFQKHTSPCLHSCPFASTRGSKHPLPFVRIRTHSWFNPPLHSCPFVVQNTASGCAAHRTSSSKLPTRPKWERSRTACTKTANYAGESAAWFPRSVLQDISRGAHCHVPS